MLNIWQSCAAWWQICALKKNYLELRRIKPRLRRLKECLEEAPYAGETFEADVVAHRVNYYIPLYRLWYSHICAEKGR